MLSAAVASTHVKAVNDDLVVAKSCLLLKSDLNVVGNRYIDSTNYNIDPTQRDPDFG